MSSAQHLMDFSQTSIADFYSGKTIAITGGTGFVGQCVIEKLLRCCPGVKKIFVLLRKKRNMTADERIAKFLELPIFGQVKETQSDFKTKIVPIYCNLEEDGLGLDETSIRILQAEVNVFIHSAATLRFDEPLKLAFKLNTLAVRLVVNLCRGMKNLAALVHVSTAYSYCNRKVVHEEVYQTGWDFDKLHDAMQWMTDEMIEKLTPNILRDRPNTYTLTKAFGEEVVVKEGEGLPICIVRPSIIGAAYDEPVPGWCTNLNGLTGLLIATAKGLIHSLPVASHLNVDIIPVDFVANGIIAAGWKTGLSRQNTQIPRDISEEDDHCLSKIDTVARSLHCIPDADSAATHRRRKSMPIYQIVVGKNNVNAKQWRDLVLKNCHSYPYDSVFQTPSMQLTNNKTLYRLQAFVVDYIPAFCADSVLSFLRQTPKMLRYQNRISGLIDTLYFFISQQWQWMDGSVEKLQRDMSEEDRKAFNVISHSIDWEKYMRDYVIGSKKFIMKENVDDYPAARRRLMKTRIIGYTLQGLIFVAFWRCFVSRTFVAKVNATFKAKLQAF